MPATLEPPAVPAAQTPAPTPAPDAPSETMNEEARGILSNIFNFGSDNAEKMRKEDKAKKPAEPEKKPDEKPPEVAKVEDEPAKADTDKTKPKPPPPRKAPAIDPVDLAVQTARETAKAMGKELGDSLLKNQERRDESRNQRAETAVVESLTPKQRSKHEVLVEMAKAQPDRYSAAPAEYLTSLKAAESYKLEWQKQNPGKRFDPSNEEHDSFFEAVEPQYDEDDYADARSNLKLRPIQEQLKVTKEMVDKVTKIEEAEEVRRVEPIATQSGIAAANEVLRKIDPKYLETLLKTDCWSARMNGSISYRG